MKVHQLLPTEIIASQPNTSESQWLGISCASYLVVRTNWGKLTRIFDACNWRRSGLWSPEEPLTLENDSVLFKYVNESVRYRLQRHKYKCLVMYMLRSSQTNFMIEHTYESNFRSKNVCSSFGWWTRLHYNH